MKTLKKLKAELENGEDTALLRFSLGSAYLKKREISNAIEHLSKAVEMDDGQATSWKLLGQAYASNEQYTKAHEAFEKSLKLAEIKGNHFIVRELKTFLSRLEEINN